MKTASASTQSHPFRSALLVLTASWIATEAISALSECLMSAAPAETSAPVVAVASGQSERGVPVYRLPPVTVTAARSVAALETTAPKREAVEARVIRSRSVRSPS
jgi:hypothetical protein